MLSTLTARSGALRMASARPTVVRKSMVVKAFKEESEATSTSSGAPSQLKPVLDFLVAEDVKLATITKPITDSEIYAKYLKSYAESSVAKESIGWKKLPETINARLAMLGFFAGASAEIFGAGSLLKQFATLPLAVVIPVLLITAASIIPVVKATEGNYLASLRETYSIPEGYFTETNEKLYGRVAMLGFTSLLVIELVIGKALL